MLLWKFTYIVSFKSANLSFFKVYYYRLQKLINEADSMLSSSHGGAKPEQGRNAVLHSCKLSEG
jgi:hypothetical protein